jgi:putative protease
LLKFILESGELNVGEEVWVTGPTTGILQMILKELYVDGVKKDQAVKGDLVTFAVEKRVRRADKLFRVVNK